jgi:hypothetical protein
LKPAPAVAFGRLDMDDDETFYIGHEAIDPWPS